MIGESPRLILREFLVEDAEALLSLNSDPEVLKYTGDVPFLSIQDAKNFVLNYDQFKKYGYGRWAVVEKETNQFIGWCGLKYHPKTDEVDLGFRLLRTYWNKGIATEAAKLSLEIGFNHLNIERIIGRVVEENIASKRVLEKIGMHSPQAFIFDEHPGLKYELSKEDYERRTELPKNK